ncbi:hypothetical protein ACH5RR_038669 [Cinchona calisaya]|uniref:MSP domain-containing protein n=1 Tax=Cinchona calisaya TaxID=153742 RepID=A0ABD2XXS4_9GENT
MASGGKFLKIEPLELRFTFEPRKQISCCLHLSNPTNNHVAFKAMVSNRTNYCVRPNTGIILPQTTCGITVIKQAQHQPPIGMQCKDKFKIQSVLLSSCVDLTYITKNVGKNISKMERFNVEPMEVKFPFEVNKRISSSLKLSNMTENYVAFKVMSTHPKDYGGLPNRGIVVPQSATDVTEVPPDTWCKPRFLVRTAVVSPTTTEEDINHEMFAKAGLVKDFKLIAVHTLAPQAAVPAAEGSEACSSKKAYPKHNDSSSNISQEFRSCDSKKKLRSSPSIFGRIVDSFGFTSRSHHGYEKLE